MQARFSARRAAGTDSAASAGGRVDVLPNTDLREWGQFYRLNPAAKS